MIAAERTMLHDVGVIDFPASGASARRWFINVAGAGYDAYVLSRLPRRVPSTLAYLKGAITGLAGYRSPVFGITAGGERIDDRLLLALVANGRYCGNRMHVAPVARMDDGLLDVVLVRDVNLPTVLTKIPKLYLGTILHDPVVRHRQAVSVRIEAEPRVAVEADGQVVGETPAEFSIRTRAIRVVTANSGRAPASA
jgi:diacylglycerol kinase family enzyme